jgi:hypothetical protein
LILAVGVRRTFNKEGKMNSAIELHDSECVSIEHDSRGNGAVILKAYVHRHEGEFGDTPHEGGEQLVRITIDSITVTGETGALPSTIWEGSLTVGEAILNNLIPFPAEHKGPITLSLTLFDNARQVEITGRSIAIVPESVFRFIERVDFTHSAAPEPPPLF